MAHKWRELTAEELAAVQGFAVRHGRIWKAEMRLAWMAASEPGIVQALRNELGPAWLRSFELPAGGAR